MVQFHLCRFEAWAISFTPLCPCLSEETLKAVGPNSCVSSRLGCLEYNYLRLEVYLCCDNKNIVFSSVNTSSGHVLLRMLLECQYCCTIIFQLINWYVRLLCALRYIVCCTLMLHCNVSFENFVRKFVVSVRWYCMIDLRTQATSCGQ